MGKRGEGGVFGRNSKILPWDGEASTVPRPQERGENSDCATDYSKNVLRLLLFPNGGRVQPPNNDPGFSSQNFTYGASGDNALCMKIGTRDEEGRKKKKEKSPAPSKEREGELRNWGKRKKSGTSRSKNLPIFGLCV